MWHSDDTHQRLLRSVSMSTIAACDSGQSDSNTGDDDDKAFPPSAGNVLNVNCGPIQRRLCGPACVIISTYNTVYSTFKIHVSVTSKHTVTEYWNFKALVYGRFIKLYFIEIMQLMTFKSVKVMG